MHSTLHGVAAERLGLLKIGIFIVDYHPKAEALNRRRESQVGKLVSPNFLIRNMCTFLIRVHSCGQYRSVMLPKERFKNCVVKFPLHF